MMVRRNAHSTSARKIVRGWYVGIGLSLIVVGGGVVGYHDYVLGKSILRSATAMQESYDSHHWAILANELANISPKVQQLNKDTNWISFFKFIPYLGPSLKKDKQVLQALQMVSTAAQRFQPFSARFRSGIPLTARGLAPRAVLAAAAAVKSLASLPTFPRASVFARLNAIHAVAIRWVGLAQLITQNARGVAGALNPSSTERFLLIFQDSGEMRSAGGFMAAYGFLTLHNGEVHLRFGSNISGLAKKVRLVLPAPWVLTRYFGAKSISFINANLNPNVPASAQTIEKLYNSVPHHLPIDGVIFADSWLAQQAVGLLGSIRVDGVLFDEQNFYLQSEYMAEDRGLPNSSRMMFLGRIAQTLYNRVRESRILLGNLVSTLKMGLDQKHLMIYANNPELEQWLIGKHWTGTIPRLANANSLMVVNDNYGGLKDNHFMTSHVDVALTKLPTGRYEEKVTTTWTFSGVANGWLIGTYVGWVQCLMPPGTKLVRLVGYHVNGVRVTAEPSINRTSFGTGILIAPRNTATSPPNVRSLTWVFLLPQIRHPERLHVIIQPGMPGQELTYRGAGGALVNVQQLGNTVVNLGLSN